MTITTLTIYRPDARTQSIPFGEYMTRAEEYEAEAGYRAFLTNKPNPPEHADFMAAAARLYPKLPPGVQQNALDCLYRHGNPAAKRYAANAMARHLSNERRLMGTTLNAWRAKRADEAKPYVFKGVSRLSPKEKRERLDALERYLTWMLEPAARKTRRTKPVRPVSNGQWQATVQTQRY